MKKQQQWLVTAFVAISICTTPALANESDADKCATKVSEIDAAIGAARKEGRMRKIATLKDLRVEALRCEKKHKTE